MLLAVVIAFGLSMVFEAQAAAPVTFYRVGTQDKWVSTIQQACEDYNQRFSGGQGTLTVDTACHITWPGHGGPFNVPVSTAPLCSDGSNPDTTKPLAQQCSGLSPPTCAPDAGKTIAGERYVVQSPSKLAYGVNFCLPVSGTSGGCAVGSVSRTGTLNLSTGKWEYIYWGPFTAVGQVCNGNGTGATDPVKDVPQICDAGLCQGAVNGVQVCVKCSQSDSATNKNQSTTNPDGSTTQTTTTTNVSFNDNSVTTNTTTTTTTTPAGGGAPTTTTKTDGTTESKDSYCQRNPSDPNCKDQKGQVSGGDDCNAPPVCTGDAIQCAMVMQQFKTRCDMQKTDAAVVLGQQLATGQDPMASQLPNPSKADQVDLSSRLSNVDNMGITAQCMPDLHIPLGALPGASGGSSLNISTGPLCDFGKLFGILNLIGTTVLCAYMLRGSF